MLLNTRLHSFVGFGLALLLLTAPTPGPVTETPWTLSLAADPPVLNLAASRATTVRVTLAYTGTQLPPAASLLCPPPTGGAIVDVAHPAHALQEAEHTVAWWQGTPPVMPTTLFTYTVAPLGVPSALDVQCGLYLTSTALAPFATATVAVPVMPHTVYLPVLTRAARHAAVQHTVAVHPAAAWHILGAGRDLGEARRAGTYLWRYDRFTTVANTPPDAVRPDYHVERGLVGFDLRAVPPGQIVSATLELHVFGYGDVQGDFTVAFHRGTWSAPPTLADWDAHAEFLGVFATAQHVPGTGVITVPLPGLVGQPVPAHLNLLLRGDEMTALPWGAQSWCAHFALHLPDTGGVYRPASRLHLIVQE